MRMLVDKHIGITEFCDNESEGVEIKETLQRRKNENYF